MVLGRSVYINFTNCKNLVICKDQEREREEEKRGNGRKRRKEREREGKERGKETIPIKNTCSFLIHFRRV